jgi:hypothetical protein
MRSRFLLLAALLGALLSAPATAAAEINPSEDVFNQQTFNPLDANGREVPFTTAQNVSRQYNSDAFTFDPAFETLERGRSGCGSTNAVRASRTAYMRFLPGVRGTLSITATTGYDVVLFGYRTSQPRHDKRFAEGELITITCNDAGKGVGNELNMVMPSAVVNPNEAILIASGSSCGIGDATKCTGNEPGGPTTLSVRFTPDDRDADGTPDTLDACPDTPGQGTNGCPPPDDDADGVPDSSDSCPHVRGVPPTGCPLDTDGDGFPNESDNCPFEFGTNPGGCPDPDNDLVQNTADLCPFVAGIRIDGCPDRDSDGVSDRVDKCPTVAGNGSNGCPGPLGARFPDRWLGFPSSTRVLRLQSRAPKGARVELRCKGRGCKVKRKVFTQKRTIHSLLPYLPKSRMLRKGIVLEIRATAPRTLGTYVRFTIRGTRLPSRLDRCIASNGKLRKCP